MDLGEISEKFRELGKLLADKEIIERILNN